MKMSDILIHEAVFLAEAAFKDKKDKSGFPYVGHLYRVAARVEELGGRPEVVAAAMLHDLLEDTTGYEEALTMFGGEVKILVEIVSRYQEETYADYITRIIMSKNRDAILIKLADMEDNTDPARLPLQSDGTEGVQNPRYAKWYPVIEAAFYGIQVQ